MNIQNPTLSATADLAHFRHFRHFRHLRNFIRRGGFSSLFTKVCSTNVEIALQIHSILTNKPNFMRFSPENDDLTKNKPNLSQNKPNSNPISRKAKIDAKCVFTKDYEDICEYGQKKQTQFKPNQSQCRQRFQHRPL